MTEYTLTNEATRILELLTSDERLQVPSEVKDIASKVQFVSKVGTNKPVVPTPLKFTESSAAIWGLVGSFANAIIIDRYGKDQDQEVSIDLDRATTNLLSVGLIKLNGLGLWEPLVKERHYLYDKHENLSMMYRTLATNIYETKDGKYYHLHGSMNSDPTLTMLDLPLKRPDLKERPEIIDFYSKEVKKYDSEWLNTTANERYRQAGAIVITKEEFAETEHGKVMLKAPLYSFSQVNPELPSVEWPKPTKGTGRPLEGIKVIDVSRVIAAPQISKQLAYLGATVIRISNASSPDFAIVLFDSQLGKKDVTLNLKTEEGKKTLESLIADADVFVDGYRPGALARLGFSQSYVQLLAKQRNKGIVFVRECCYGFEGPWAHRSGWQQISDCITGACWEQGKFLGLNEPVIPVLPNADYQVAFSGVAAVLNALFKRKVHGGSYNIDLSLTAYDVFLLKLGTLPEEEQQRLKELAAKDTDPKTSLLNIRHFDDMTSLFQKAAVYFKKVHPHLFEERHFGTSTSNWNIPDETVTFLLPPLEFNKVELSFDIGTTKAGAHTPEW